MHGSTQLIFFGLAWRGSAHNFDHFAHHYLIAGNTNCLFKIIAQFVVFQELSGHI